MRNHPRRPIKLHFQQNTSWSVTNGVLRRAISCLSLTRFGIAAAIICQFLNAFLGIGSWNHAGREFGKELPLTQS